MFKLNKRSITNLVGVHKDLVLIVNRTAELYNGEFIVTEGLRTVARQKELFAKNLSKTMKSRHITGHAVDLAVKIDGTISWKWHLYEELNDIVQVAAKELKIPVEWGGSWLTLRDGVHFQLPKAKYPAIAS